ncbi:hypothetical protein BC936DRAFT_138499, partial [Jimgerdemannia flammicorona]
MVGSGRYVSIPVSLKKWGGVRCHFFLYGVTMADLLSIDVPSSFLSRRYRGMGTEPARCGVPVWRRCGAGVISLTHLSIPTTVPTHQQPGRNCARAPARYGGLQTYVQQYHRHCVVRAELLCGNVAAILELDENLNKNYKIFEAAPQVGCAPSPTFLFYFRIFGHQESDTLI